MTRKERNAYHFSPKVVFAKFLVFNLKQQTNVCKKTIVSRENKTFSKK